MNNIKHGIFVILLILALIGFQDIIKQNDDELHSRSSSNNGWDEALIPLWSSSLQNTENYQFGPVLIVLLAILSVFGLLKYYYSKEKLDNEY